MKRKCFFGLLVVYLGDELGNVIAQAHGVDSAVPTLAHDAANNQLQLLRRGNGTFGTQVLQFFQLPGFEEEPRHAKRPFLGRDLVRQHEGLDKGPSPVALEVFGQHFLEALRDLVERTTVRIAIMHDLDELDGATLHDLIEHYLLLENTRLLLLIGFEAPDVMQHARSERAEKCLEVLAIPFADGAELHWILQALFGIIGEFAHRLVRRAGNEILALREQAVVVLVEPAARAVLDNARIMADGEALVRSGAHVVPSIAGVNLRLLEDLAALRIFRGVLGDLLAEYFVGGVLLQATREARAKVVQRGEHRADAIHHGSGIGHGDVLPWQRLALVKVLLSRKLIFHEVLLESLVREVDAQLLERILLQPLEAINVEDPDVPPFLVDKRRIRAVAQVSCERIVDAPHHLLEQPLVQGLDEAVKRLPELHRRPGDFVERLAATDVDALTLEGASKLARVHPKQLCSVLNASIINLHRRNLVFVDDGLLQRDASLILDSSVAKVYEAREYLQCSVDSSFVEANCEQ
mmetsp:Transcript_47959/g.133700  ORF Transcript_47959/g.133700 Transcript_47959/m.133700 type:complete len:521 (+) Transcript_47959:1926-3488(+)